MIKALQTAAGRYIAALVIAMAVTALCLFLLPISLRFSAPIKKDLLGEAVKLADYRKPPPPPPKKKEVKKKPKPKKVAPKLKSFMPKMGMDSSALTGTFQFDLGLAGGTGVGMDLGAKIFDESKVDAKPVVLFRTQPVYPSKAQNEQLTGRVSFRFLVDRDGMVKDVEILGSEPRGVFDRATVTAVKQWRFQPAKVKGEAVACWCQSSIKYELDLE